MSLPWYVQAGTLALALLVTASGVGSAAAQMPTVASGRDMMSLVLPDTLPPYRDVRGTSRERTALVAAVVDALHGRLAYPPPLVLRSFRREGRTVMIDMVADSLPRIRWRNGGGTVHILADGRRVIVRRHN